MHIDRLTPEIFAAEYRSQGRPLVIEGALPTSADAWSLEHVREQLGVDPFTCRIHGADGYSTSPDRWAGRSHARRAVLTTARQFADTIAAGSAAAEDCYVQADIRHTPAGRALAPVLQRVADATGLCEHAKHGPVVNMWWGPCGHVEPVHMDVTDGTLCQLRGRKHVVLFPPKSWADLYPFAPSARGMSWAFSQVALGAPDLARFPRVRDALAHRIELVLEPGDVLYIPACAAHEIAGGLGTDHVLSVNRFWHTPAERVLPHLPADAKVAYASSDWQ